MSPLVQEENGKTSCCFGSNPIVEAWFNPKEGKCHLRARTVALADVECSEAEFLRIKTFLSQVAKHRSGSLKTCDRNNKVHVRGFRKSVMCYSNSGFPPVYELHIEDAVVNGVEC
ncbi:hypothetical protein O6H91_04G078500 [Diphasiastrum complanatum]|nr:hypothetical protein O6H91_04G078500 [Diphasiastrum complanatum]